MWLEAVSHACTELGTYSFSGIMHYVLLCGYYDSGTEDTSLP